MTNRLNSQERGCVCRPRHNRATSAATALRPDGFLMLVQILAIFESKPGTSWSDLCAAIVERHRMAHVEAARVSNSEEGSQMVKQRQSRRES